MSPSDDASLADRLEQLAIDQVETHTLILLDRQGTIVGWRGGAERVLGYRADEIVGKNVSILFVPEDLEKELATWEQRTADAVSEAEDDRWQLRKDGVRIWVSGTLTALRDESGELVGFAKIMRNRTDHKTQVEALELRLASADEERNRSNAFVATLTHELRGPLSALSTAATYLEASTSDDPDFHATVAIVKRQVAFMSRLTDDLMGLARTTMGKNELDLQEIVLQDVVQLAIEAAQAAVLQPGHTLVQLLPDVPVHLVGDAMRLGQVIINLIHNAARFTEPGGTIWVKATTEGEEAVVRVKDSGVGIEPDVMPRIFDLFTQVDFAGRPHQGLGIGLWVVKENVALHGGTVQATSDGIGRGSEFIVRLPLKGPKSVGQE
jgi:PAS domain S-box-containing protein